MDRLEPEEPSDSHYSFMVGDPIIEKINEIVDWINEEMKGRDKNNFDKSYE